MDDTTSQPMLMIDGHVHIYQQYDWAGAVHALIDHLSASLPPGVPRQKAILIGLLAESKACRFFNEVIERRSPLTKGSLQVEAGPDTDSLIIREAGIIKGYLIAGRQLVTAENLEVLALGMNTSISSGLPLAETVKSITGKGAIPVLSWSPGKWFFHRGKLVNSLIHSHSAGSFLIGDIGLRPNLWPLPRLMKMAAQRGFKIIGGSDSLPLAGEERWIGHSGFQVVGAFNPHQPAASVRNILINPASAFIPAGNHCSLLDFARRWGKNQVKK